MLSPLSNTGTSRALQCGGENMGSGAGSQSSIYALPLTAFISFDSDYLLVCASISSSVKWE